MNRPRLFVAAIACLVASSCGTVKTKVLDETIPSVANTVLDCAQDATHHIAIGLLDDVATALANKNWIGLLKDLVGRWGDDAIDCAVHEVAGQSNHNAMAMQDPLEGEKAARGRQWLASRGR